MTPPIGFRTGKSVESENSIMEIRPAAALTDTSDVLTAGASPSRAADYAYRIAALTAGLILLATVM
ncbi:MAG TPA: hypothetical protein VL495_10375 [Edaphobacter sp.]|nr:hypothetical protein [Edaphobacter sp.]